MFDFAIKDLVDIGFSSAASLLVIYWIAAQLFPSLKPGGKRENGIEDISETIKSLKDAAGAIEKSQRSSLDKILDLFKQNNDVVSEASRTVAISTAKIETFCGILAGAMGRLNMAQDKVTEGLKDLEVESHADKE